MKYMCILFGQQRKYNKLPAAKRFSRNLTAIWVTGVDEALSLFSANSPASRLHSAGWWAVFSGVIPPKFEHELRHYFSVYRVARNFCRSLFLRIGDFMCFAETNFLPLGQIGFSCWEYISAVFRKPRTNHWYSCYRARAIEIHRK